MKKKIILFVFCFNILFAHSQTTIGIGIYPTGTESGLGLRLNKDKRLSAEARVTRFNLYSDSKAGQSSFLTEASAIYRIILLEKVRFHVGLGMRADWNFTTSNKFGGVIPIGVEAFPFPFQNAGLFFESAPYLVSDKDSKLVGGLRSVAGFVFYFSQKRKSKDMC